MNWQTYNHITSEQKEEYNFRFKDKPILSLGENSWFIFSLLLYFILFMAVSYLITTGDENFIQFEDNFQDLFDGMTRILSILLVVVIINSIINIVNYFYYYLKEFWWIRKNNIVKHKDYFWRKNKDGQ